MSIFIIHLSVSIGAHYHRMKIKNIDKTEKIPKYERPQKKSISTKKESPAKKWDSLSETQEKAVTEADTVRVEKPSPISDTEFFDNLLEKYNAKGAKANGNSESRTDVVIRYYKKSNDGDRVYKLRNLGFYIHERPAEDDFNEYASNAIFYGDAVKKEDLVMIAYSLMKNGVKLQSITLSKFHDAWKAHSIEIGTDTTALNEQPITLAKLRKEWADM